MKSPFLRAAAAIAAAALAPALFAAPAAEASVSCAKAGGALYVYMTADGDAANVRMTEDGKVAVAGTSGGVTAPESCSGAAGGTPSASDIANVTFSDQSQAGSTEARVQDPYVFYDRGLEVYANFYEGDADTLAITGTPSYDEMALLADGFIPNTNPSGFDNPQITWDEVDRFEIRGLGGGDSINAGGDLAHPGVTQPVTIDAGSSAYDPEDGFGYIIGGLGPDTILGSPVRDEIVANAGSDQINARGGDDRILGGAGRDSIVAGAGSDKVNAQNSDRDKRLSCGGGTDRLAKDRNDPKPAGCELKLRDRV